jgi:hypothetical protein
VTTRPNRLAWLRLNAYGVLLAFIALMGVQDLITPAGAPLAQVVGEVPPGQNFWVGGIVIAGLMMFWGFVRADRLVETCALVFLTLAVAAQTIVAWSMLGWTEFTLTRCALLGAVILCSSARASALWSREGMVITIPARRRVRKR